MLAGEIKAVDTALQFVALAANSQEDFAFVGLISLLCEGLRSCEARDAFFKTVFVLYQLLDLLPRYCPVFIVISC